MLNKINNFTKRLLSLIPLVQPIAITSFTFIFSSYSAVYANDYQTYFDSGFKKGEKGDYFGAIYDYTSSIELNSNNYRSILQPWLGKSSDQ